MRCCTDGDLLWPPCVADADIILQILNKCLAVETELWTGANRTSVINLRVNGQSAGPYSMDCSVAQGSVLGPLKFIGYTEDLAELIHSHISATIYTQTTLK